MNNKDTQRLLKELESKKNSALAQTVKYFPSQFYKFGEMVLKTPLFWATLKKIEDSRQYDYPDYDEMIKQGNQLVVVLHKTLSKYLASIESADLLIAQLQLIPTNKVTHPILIIIRIGDIGSIIAALGHHYDDFVKQNAKKMAQLKEFQNVMVKENNHVNRMATVREWGALQRIFRICQTYNQKWYESTRADFVKAERNMDVVHLDICHAALKRCIEPGVAEPNDYDLNFGMAADKLAIQDIYDCIERELLIEDSREHIGNKDYAPQKIKFSKYKTGARVTYGALSVSIGLKSEEKRINKRKEIAILFSSKTEVSGGEFFKAISDHASNQGSLSRIELEEVEKTIADFNKLLKKELKLSTVIRIKSIDRSYGQIKVFINPKYY